MGNSSFGLGWAKAVEHLTNKFRKLAVATFAVGAVIGAVIVSVVKKKGANE